MHHGRGKAILTEHGLGIRSDAVKSLLGGMVERKADYSRLRKEREMKKCALCT
jgi:hypothetical protein